MTSLIRLFAATLFPLIFVLLMLNIRLSAQAPEDGPPPRENRVPECLFDRSVLGPGDQLEFRFPQPMVPDALVGTTVREKLPVYSEPGWKGVF
ncbi:MAG: hypothetical protein AAF514_16035, partial [Verrucomicrobiota bacterium]